MQAISLISKVINFMVVFRKTGSKLNSYSTSIFAVLPPSNIVNSALLDGKLNLQRALETLVHKL